MALTFSSFSSFDEVVAHYENIKPMGGSNNKGKDIYFEHLAGRIGYKVTPPKEGIIEDSYGCLLPKGTVSGWGEAYCYLTSYTRDVFQIMFIITDIQSREFKHEEGQTIIFDIPSKYKYGSEIEIIVNENIHKSVAIVNGDIKSVMPAMTYLFNFMMWQELMLDIIDLDGDKKNNIKTVFHVF